MKTRYLVLPYELWPRNEIEAQQACRTDAEVLRTGERTAKRCCGIVAISQACDETADFAADPIAIHGTVFDQRNASDGPV